MSSSSEAVVTSFVQFQQTDGKDAKTIRSYTGDTRAFLQWLEDKGQPFRGQFTRFHLTRYLNQLKQALPVHHLLIR